jgi:hypothetical protein
VGSNITLNNPCSPEGINFIATLKLRFLEEDRRVPVLAKVYS